MRHIGKRRSGLALGAAMVMLGLTGATAGAQPAVITPKTVDIVIGPSGKAVFSPTSVTVPLVNTGKKKCTSAKYSFALVNDTGAKQQIYPFGAGNPPIQAGATRYECANPRGTVFLYLSKKSTTPLSVTIG